MKTFFYWTLVRPVEITKMVIRKITKRKIETWHIERAFIFTVLAAVALITRRPWVEWFGVAAVTLTFNHASVANRLEEKEGERVRKGGTATVECYRWLQRYFYGKEATWFVYFLLIEAYSALVGVIVFFFYGQWRALWRSYHPIEEAQEESELERAQRRIRELEAELQQYRQPSVIGEIALDQSPTP